MIKVQSLALSAIVWLFITHIKPQMRAISSPIWSSRYAFSEQESPMLSHAIVSRQIPSKASLAYGGLYVHETRSQDGP